MEDRDGVVVAADDERGAGDVMQLVQGNMRLIEVQVRDLELSFDLGCRRLFVEGDISPLNQIPYKRCEAGGIGP